MRQINSARCPENADVIKALRHAGLLSLVSISLASDYATISRQFLVLISPPVYISSRSHTHVLVTLSDLDFSPVHVSILFNHCVLEDLYIWHSLGHMVAITR